MEYVEKINLTLTTLKIGPILSSILRELSKTSKVFRTAKTQSKSRIYLYLKSMSENVFEWKKNSTSAEYYS